MDGALYLPGGSGLKPEGCPAKGLEDENGAVVGEAGCMDGLATETSDPTIGPGDIKAEVPGPATGRDDKKGVILLGVGEGDRKVPEGIFVRRGSSVPIMRLTVGHLLIVNTP